MSYNCNELVLDLSDQGLTTLKGFDLSRVTHLICSHNKLTSLPTLPYGLKILDCGFNEIISLPDILPIGLKGLYCYRNKLSSLPILPKGLRDLNCSDNFIISLPMLPKYLKFFEGIGNKFYPYEVNIILLQQHNQRRADLGLLPVKMRIDEDFEDIWHHWTLLQYQLDSVEYKKAEKEIN